MLSLNFLFSGIFFSVFFLSLRKDNSKAIVLKASSDLIASSFSPPLSFSF